MLEVLRSCVTKLASPRTPQLFKVRVDGLELQGLADGLAREFTQTGEVDLTHTNVHAVAGLLKLWLRKLPAPALTFELYGEWTSELNVPTLATSDDVLAQNLRKVAAKLPSGHFEVCVLLFALLHAVDGSGGLAKAFTPLLLRPRGETVAGAAESAQRRQKVVSTLIHWRQNLPEAPAARAAVARRSRRRRGRRRRRRRPHAARFDASPRRSGQPRGERGEHVISIAHDAPLSAPG